MSHPAQLPPVPGYADTWPRSRPCTIVFRPRAPDPRVGRAEEHASARAVRRALVRALISSRLRRPGGAILPHLARAIVAEWHTWRALVRGRGPAPVVGMLTLMATRSARGPE